MQGPRIDLRPSEGFTEQRQRFGALIAGASENRCVGCAGNLLKVARDPDRHGEMLEAAERLICGDPQLAFNVRLSVVLGQKQTEPLADDLRDDTGRVLAARRQSKRSTAITFGASADAGLADYVWDRLPTLVDDYRRQQMRQRK